MVAIAPLRGCARRGDALTGRGREMAMIEPLCRWEFHLSPPKNFLAEPAGNRGDEYAKCRHIHLSGGIYRKHPRSFWDEYATQPVEPRSRVQRGRGAAQALEWCLLHHCVAARGVGTQQVEPGNRTPRKDV